jgi:hypothetical protein
MWNGGVIEKELLSSKEISSDAHERLLLHLRNGFGLPGNQLRCLGWTSPISIAYRVRLATS